MKTTQQNPIYGGVKIIGELIRAFFLFTFFFSFLFFFCLREKLF